MNELRDEIERVLLQITPEDRKKAKDDEIARGGEKGISLNSRAAIYSLDRQLKSSLTANREQKAEIERLRADVKMWKFMVEDSAEHQLAVSEGALHARQGKPMNPSYSASGKLNYSYQSAYEDVQSRMADEAELASLRASVGEKWIEIKEGCEMPMSGDRVLVHEHGTVFFAYFQSARQSWIGDLPDVFLDSSDGHFTAVTHWRPLPAPPTLPGEEK